MSSDGPNLKQLALFEALLAAQKKLDTTPARLKWEQAITLDILKEKLPNTFPNELAFACYQRRPEDERNALQQNPLFKSFMLGFKAQALGKAGNQPELYDQYKAKYKIS